MAAEAASFKISIDLTSDGLRSCKPSGTGNPSTITSGALSAEIEPVPRTRIVGATPTSEVTLLMFSPEI